MNTGDIISRALFLKGAQWPLQTVSFLSNKFVIIKLLGEAR